MNKPISARELRVKVSSLQKEIKELKNSSFRTLFDTDKIHTHIEMPERIVFQPYAELKINAYSSINEMLYKYKIGAPGKEKLFGVAAINPELLFFQNPLHAYNTLEMLFEQALNDAWYELKGKKK